MEDKVQPIAADEVSARPVEPERVVAAEQLFAGRREVVLEHAGARYRLRITRRGKLILQK
jgi:hemin uptake protein HemP